MKNFTYYIKDALIALLLHFILKNVCQYDPPMDQYSEEKDVIFFVVPIIVPFMVMFVAWDIKNDKTPK